MDKKSHFLSVIIPTYNKAAKLYQFLNTLSLELEKVHPHFELIIVNDGSRDHTKKELERYQKDYNNVNLKIYEYPMNVGKGFALNFGFGKSSGNPILFYDADFDLHPAQIKNFLDIYFEKNPDIVIGSKRHPQSKVSYPYRRKIYSHTLQILTHLLFNLNITDSQVGLKLFQRKVLENVLPKIVVKRFACDLEILVVAHHLGFRNIIEAPIELNHQFTSTVSYSDIRGFLSDIMAIFYRKNIIRYYNDSD